MKTKLFSKRALLGLCLGASLFIASCSKDDNDNNNTGKDYAVSGNGSGSQVVPSVSTTANSTLSGTYNTGTNLFTYNVNWTGLAATASGVRFYGPAAAGANAAGSAMYDVSITTPGIAGNASGSVTLTEAQETDLLAGNWYYTVSNTTNTAGEVRGQVTATAE